MSLILFELECPASIYEEQINYDGFFVRIRILSRVQWSLSIKNHLPVSQFEPTALRAKTPTEIVYSNNQWARLPETVPYFGRASWLRIIWLNNRDFWLKFQASEG
jgi:hypothetical protein